MPLLVRLPDVQRYSSLPSPRLRLPRPFFVCSSDTLFACALASVGQFLRLVFQGGFFCLGRSFPFPSLIGFSFFLSGPCWGPCNNPHQKKKKKKRCSFRLFPNFRWDALRGIYSDVTLPYLIFNHLLVDVTGGKEKDILVVTEAAPVTSFAAKLRVYGPLVPAISSHCTIDHSASPTVLCFIMMASSILVSSV